MKYLITVTLELAADIPGDDQQKAADKFVKEFGVQFNEPGESKVQLVDADLAFQEEPSNLNDE